MLEMTVLQMASLPSRPEEQLMLLSIAVAVTIPFLVLGWRLFGGKKNE